MGAYTLLQDLTVTTNSTSVVLNNFGTITKDDFIKVVVTHRNLNATTNGLRLLANNSVNSDYTRQTLVGSGSSVSAGRVTTNTIAHTQVGGHGLSLTYLKLSENNRLNIFAQSNRDMTSGTDLFFQYVTSHNVTFPSGITSFTFQNESGSIGIGSRMQIYRLDAEKVADFTVATNSTQVDIPFPTGTFSPAIDKDSEYLLITDHISNGAQIRYELFPNDLTTSTNYYSQLISGFGSSTGAGRENNATINFQSVSGSRVMTYNHIKLSNIGAYTVQNYQNRLYGTSDILLTNRFISSTAENITSITKLNIRSGTNGIAAGSRFILYKLYE